MHSARGSRRCLTQLAVLGTISSLALAACGSGSSASNGGSGARAKGPLNEAIVIAYTGPVSFEGGAADSGVYPAVHEINQAGGIMGRQVNVVTEDTRGDPADAVPIVDKMLATVHNLMGVTGPGTASSPTVAPILNSAGVTDMIWGGEASFDRTSDKYVWRLIPPDPANGEAMAIWAKDHGYTRIAAVFGTDSGSQGDLPGVLAGVKAIHASLVANVSLTPDQPSYRAEAERVIAAGPQVIMTESDGTTAATFFAELKQLGGMAPIIGTTATAISNWIHPVRSAIGAADFERYFTAVVDGTPKPSQATAAYSSALTAVSSKVPSPASQWVTNPYSGAGYDGVIIQALAMDAAHSVTPKVYNPYIDAVTKPGAGKTVVYTYAQGKRALAQGKHIQYVGATGPIVFDQYHNSFGNEAAEQVSASDQTTVVRVITEQQIQSLG